METTQENNVVTDADVGGIDPASLAAQSIAEKTPVANDPDLMAQELLAMKSEFKKLVEFKNSVIQFLEKHFPGRV